MLHNHVWTLLHFTSKWGYDPRDLSSTTNPNSLPWSHHHMNFEIFHPSSLVRYTRSQSFPEESQSTIPWQDICHLTGRCPYIKLPWELSVNRAWYHHQLAMGAEWLDVDTRSAPLCAPVNGSTYQQKKGLNLQTIIQNTVSWRSDPICYGAFRS